MMKLILNTQIFGQKKKIMNLEGRFDEICFTEEKSALARVFKEVLAGSKLLQRENKLIVEVRNSVLENKISYDWRVY